MIQAVLRVTLTSLLVLLAAALPLGVVASAFGIQDSSSGTPTVEAGADRPPDGLLDRRDLQAIVDLQITRNGAALAARLDDSDPVARARAAFALASVQDTGAVSALLVTLRDPDERVRADAAFALGQTADSTAASALLDALAAETNRVVRSRLYEALGKTGDAASLAALAERDAPPPELGQLAMAIGRFGLRGVFHDRAVARLAGLLDHEDAAVREAAAYPFGRWRDAAPWSEAAAGAVRAAVDAAYPFQAGGRGTVVPEGPTPEIHLITALGRLDDPADTQRLVRWLEDGVDWRVRVAAARALGARTSEVSAQRALLTALGDPSTHVGVAAAAALGAADSLADEVIHDLSLQTTVGKDWRVTGEVLPALAKAGVESFVILWLMWLDGRDPGNVPARAKALRALGQGSGPPGFRVLENEAKREDPRIAAAAMAGLAERWRRGARGAAATTERYFEAFRAALERGDVGTVSEAAPVLADSAFHAHGAVDLLAKTYRSMEPPRDLEAMVALLEALGRTGDSSARPLLEEALRHRDPPLRQAAAEALSQGSATAVTPSQVPDPPDRMVDWSALGELGEAPRLVLDTDRGRIVVELSVEQAPLTVQTIAAFARDGSYDGVPFHRVVPNFVIQSGDFARGDGYGGPGFEIRSEFTRVPYGRGVIGMASAGKDTEGAQFFLTHSIQPHLDGRYTAFGRVVEGLKALDAILEGDRVVSARVEASARAEP